MSSLADSRLDWSVAHLEWSARWRRLSEDGAIRVSIDLDYIIQDCLIPRPM